VFASHHASATLLKIGSQQPIATTTHMLLQQAFVGYVALRGGCRQV
jgi:hypothetical protein